MDCMKNSKEVEPEGDLELQRTNSEIKVWRSCCFGDVNKQAMVFFTQIIVLAGFLTFCCAQLVRLESCEAQTLYSSMITLTLGIICPNPRMKR